MYVLKFDCKGKVNNVDVPMDTSVVCKVDESSLADELGKVLYSLESMGYQFTTHDVYEVIMDALTKLFLDSVAYKFKAVVTYYMIDGELKLSMKLE